MQGGTRPKREKSNRRPGRGLRAIHKKREAQPFARSFLVLAYLGFLSTRITESPRKNILLMKRSLFTGLLPFLPLPDLGICARHRLLLVMCCLGGGGQIGWRGLLAGPCSTVRAAAHPSRS
jgi:hypothetical protein